MITKKNMIFILLLTCMLAFNSCAKPELIEQCVNSKPANFLNGIIHGLILPFSFLASVFKNDVTIYAVNNVGTWYNFGYIIGVSACLKGNFTILKINLKKN